jgi:transcriptional regulator with XRE-family HTH domain
MCPTITAEDFYVKVRTNLKRFRTEGGNISQKNLAIQINAADNAISNFEKGSSNLSLVDAFNATDYFGKTLDELCGRTDSKSAIRNSIKFLLKIMRYESNEGETVLSIKPHMDKLLRTISDIEVLRENMGDERVEEIIDAYIEKILPEFFNETDAVTPKGCGLGVGYSLGACPTWLRNDL